VDALTAQVIKKQTFVKVSYKFETGPEKSISGVTGI